MIVLDTSALMAILLEERGAEACAAAVEGEATLLLSAATLAEALIVADRRGVGDAMALLVAELGCEVVTVDEAFARRTAATYARWGKGIHVAGLNFGDCFAYQLAKDRNCPLLFVGEDFSATDVTLAIEAGP